MKKLFTSLLLLSFSVSSFALKSVSGEYVQKISGVEYKLKIRVSDAATGSGNGQLHAYSVYRGGKFVHSKYGDGRLWECRGWGPEKGLKEYLNATAIKNEMAVAIWRIKVTGSCGSAGGVFHRYIAVDSSDLYVEFDAYVHQEVGIISTKDGVVLSYLEESAAGNVPESQKVWIPKKLVIKKKRYGWSGTDDNQLSLDELLATQWYPTDLTKRREPFGFTPMFLVCMEQKTPKICDYAIENLFTEGDKEIQEFWWRKEKGALKRLVFENYTTLLREKLKIEKQMNLMFD